jgi:hypothetical protein
VTPNRIAGLVPAFLAALTTAACSRPGADATPFRWSESVPAGATLHLRDGAGDVIVRRGAGPTVVVTGERRWRRSRATDIRFVVNHTGNDYYVCAMWRSSGTCGPSGYRGRQFGGFLTIFSLFHRGSDAMADVTAEVPASVVVDARTSNGSVRVDGVSSGIVARTTNGTVDATNVSGSVALITTNGNVNLSADSFSDADSIHLATTNGSIHAELPASLQGAFDLSVVNGLVHSDFPVPASSPGRADRHLQGQVGSSNRVVKMRAINGMISVVSRGAATTTH